MPLDYVHDTQAVFRKVMDCMAQPGKTNSLAKQMCQIDFPIDCYHSTFLTMMTLLDSEATFHIKGNHTSLVQRIAQLTLAKHVEESEADFIIITADLPQASLIDAIQSAKKGSLIDPQLSATIIIETSELSSGQEWLLSGPGIKKEKRVKLAYSQRINQAREEKNKEFPLGIDLVITDQVGKVICLPRTTVISEVSK
ncbi:phosphonate C-P lyase system protein PhnH [Cytobacillus sp. Sa5YUA1]|uniref:Phosphonate C-P lyase system protein PhnH n=1 Tax=Cytobacillus stercorigallinarum TaxID=2762240 RepID=A0ABR8QUP0_9BACI|nr:phosphonate C-P lyase system protein PhnH [Cytobacillus stercorigallinarum]MBD7939258.1 phosphonate C-P lyase system protein PhnH [Cytobacillus stercorigallinarum]